MDSIDRTRASLKNLVGATTRGRESLFAVTSEA